MRASRRAKERLQALYSQAKARAESEGYTIDAGRFYTSTERDRQDAVEAYLSARRAVTRAAASAETALDRMDSMRNFNAPRSGLDKEQLRTYQTLLQEHKTRVEDWHQTYQERAASGGFVPAPHMSLTQMSLSSFQSQWQRYIQSIVNLANLGIATPEMALAGSGDALNDGVDRFNEYHQLHQDVLKLIDVVSERVEKWVQSTGDKVAAPTFLFEDERQQYQAYLARFEQCYNDALKAASQMQPVCQLLWIEDRENAYHEAEYKPRFVSGVTRPGFPLREFVLASREAPQAYLSMEQLISRVDNGTARRQVRQALTRELSFPGQAPATEHAMGEWLRQQGAREVPLSHDWFDEAGAFQPDALYQHLEREGLHLTTFEDDAIHERFSNALQQWLYRDPERGELARINYSYVAQMHRLRYWLDDEAAGPLQVRQQHTRIKLPVGDEDENSRIKEYEITDEWNSLQGSVTLNSFSIPPTEDAKHNQRYLVLNALPDSPRRNIGAYRLNCSVTLNGLIGLKHAWGVDVFNPFSLESDYQHDRRTVHMDNERGLHTGRKQRDLSGGVGDVEASASVSAFFGLRAGAEVLTELKWLVPEDIGEHLRLYGALQSLGMLPSNDEDDDGWCTLCRSQIMVEGGVGVGGSAGFALMLNQRQLKVRIRASLFFGKGVGGSVEMGLNIHQLSLWLAMVHQALRDNHYEYVDWIDPDAFNILERLVYVATFTHVDTGLLLMRGIQHINRLYEAMLGERHGGQLAYTLVHDPKQAELSAWVQAFPPGALGALLYTLTRAARGFEVEIDASVSAEIASQSVGDVDFTNNVIRFTPEQARLLQQQAIVRCLQYLVEGATDDAGGQTPQWSRENPLPTQWQFTKAVARLDQDGKKTDPSTGQAYCENREKLDEFMEYGVANIPEQDLQYEILDYKVYASQLSLQYEGMCQLNRSWFGQRVTFTGEDE